MKTARTTMLWAIAINAIIAVLEIVALASSIAAEGLGVLEWYTDLSNAFAGVVAIILLACEVRMLRDSREAGQRPDGEAGLSASEGLPRWARTLKLMAACCLLVTFFIVALVLAPWTADGPYGYFSMFVMGRWPITHLTCPALTFVSYVLFEGSPAPSVREGWLAMIPTTLYAAIAYLCNWLRIWDGPYPFFQVWSYPAWQLALMFVVLLALIAVVCQVPGLVARRVRRQVSL